MKHPWVSSFLLGLFSVLSLDVYSQIDAKSFYVGISAGAAFNGDKKSEGIDGGGNEAIWQQINMDPEIFTDLIQSIGGEPISLIGPDDLNANTSFQMGIQGGYFFTPIFSLGIGYNFTSFDVKGNMVINYESQNGLQSAEGSITTKVKNRNAFLNATVYFAKVWQPFITGGIVLNSQKVENSTIQFSETVFNTNSESSSSQIGYLIGLGISRNFNNKHQLSFVLDGIGYSSPYQSSTSLFDPAVKFSYHYIIPVKKSKTTDYLTAFDPLFVPPGLNFCITEGPYDVVNDLREELRKLEDEIREATKGIEDNDLIEEVKNIRAFIEALKAMGEMESAGKDALDAIEAFVQCNNKQLREQFKKSADTRSGVLSALKFLSSFLKIYAESKPKDKALLKKISDKIEKNLKKAEEALDQGKIDKALDIIEAIKTEIAWPVDVLKIILDDLWKKIDEAYKDAGKTAAKKALEAALKKVLGAGAGAAGSIAKDFVDLADLLWKMYALDELIEKRNEKLIELIKAFRKANLALGTGKQDDCIAWDFGKPAKSVTISIELICWCPDPEGSTKSGKWVTKLLKINPNDGSNKKTLTLKNPVVKGSKKIKIHVPKKEDLPCDAEYCYFRTTSHIVYKDGTTESLSGKNRALK